MKRDQRIYHPAVLQSQLPPQICYAIVLKILQNLKKKKKTEFQKRFVKETKP